MNRLVILIIIVKPSIIFYWKSHQSHGFIFGEKVKFINVAIFDYKYIGKISHIIKASSEDII